MAKRTVTLEADFLDDILVFGYTLTIFRDWEETVIAWLLNTP